MLKYLNPRGKKAGARMRKKASTVNGLLITSLIFGFLLVAPHASMAGEPAFWTQMKAACRNSGGRPSSENYNDWGAKGGCICPGSAVGSGQPTCSGSTSTSSSSGGGGDLNSLAVDALVKGLGASDINMTGLGIAGLLFSAANNSQSDASSRAAEAARAAEQRRQAEEEAARQKRLDEERAAEESRQAERRAAEERRLAAEQKRLAEERAAEQERRAEESKNRLLGTKTGADSLELSLMGLESSGELQLMTGDQLLMASNAANQPTKADEPKARSTAFTKGFEAASLCFSQNSGSACVDVTADQGLQCVEDYRAGYSAGEIEQRRILNEAFQLGEYAGKNQQPDNSFADPRASGPCRVQWIENYNQGYFQGKNSKTQF